MLNYWQTVDTISYNSYKNKTIPVCNNKTSQCSKLNSTKPKLKQLNIQRKQIGTFWSVEPIKLNQHEQFDSPVHLANVLAGLSHP